MAKNLITGWDVDKVEIGSSGSVKTAELNINTQHFITVVPHIVSPVFGKNREFSEYYHGKLVY